MTKTKRTVTAIQFPNGDVLRGVDGHDILNRWRGKQWTARADEDLWREELAHRAYCVSEGCKVDWTLPADMFLRELETTGLIKIMEVK